MEIEISVSIGEIFDKLSILEIKKKHIKDINKINHIDGEINKLLPKIDHLMDKNKILYKYLLLINEKIWHDIDKQKTLNINDIRYSNLCFRIMKENDARFRIKSMIDKQNTYTSVSLMFLFALLK